MAATDAYPISASTETVRRLLAFGFAMPSQLMEELQKILDIPNVANIIKLLCMSSVFPPDQRPIQPLFVGKLVQSSLD